MDSVKGITLTNKNLNINIPQNTSRNNGQIKSINQKMSDSIKNTVNAYKNYSNNNSNSAAVESLDLDSILSQSNRSIVPSSTNPEDVVNGDGILSIDVDILKTSLDNLNSDIEELEKEKERLLKERDSYDHHEVVGASGGGVSDILSGNKNNDDKMYFQLNEKVKEISSKLTILKYNRKQISDKYEILDVERCKNNSDYNEKTSTILNPSEIKTSNNVVNGSAITVIEKDNNNVFEGGAELKEWYSNNQKYLSEEQLKVITYLYNTGNKEQLDRYRNALQDQINKIKGLEETEKFLEILEKDPNAMETIGNFTLTLGEGITDGSITWVEGLQNLFNETETFSETEYKQMFIASALAQNEKWNNGNLSMAYGLGTSLGNMVPSIVIGTGITVATEGAGAPAAFANLGRVAGTFAIGLSAAGNAKHEAITKGADIDAAWIYGIANGLSEAGLEYALGVIPGIGKESKSLLISMAQEGGEEFAQTMLEGLEKHIILGEEIDISDLLEEGKEAALCGAIMGGAFNIGKGISNTTKIAVKIKDKIVNISTEELGVDPEQAIKDYKNGNSEGINKLRMNLQFFAKDSNTSAMANDSRYQAPNLETLQYQKMQKTTQLEQTRNVIERIMNNYNSLRNDDSIIREAVIYTGQKNNYSESLMSELIQVIKNGGKNGVIQGKNAINCITSENGHRQSVIEYLNALDTYSNEINRLNNEYVRIGNELSNIDNRIKDITTKSSEVGQSLRNEINATINPKWDNISKIRKLYIELNKRVSYDENYMKADQQVKNSMKNRISSYDNLQGTNVICKGWAELYYETLIDNGFSPNQVRIVNSNNTHWWVEIQVDADNIIIADATDNVLNAIDLSNCKSGTATYGLVLTGKNNSGMRLKDLVAEGLIGENDFDIKSQNEYWRKIDQKIGYINKKSYRDELIAKAKTIFGTHRKLKLSDADDIIYNVEFPHKMTGLDAYGYYKTMINALCKNNKELIPNLPINEIYMGRTNSGYESVVTLCNRKRGIFMIYSESIGKYFFNTETDYNNYLKSLENIK